MIYLDHNATSPMRPEVWEAMARVEFGTPGGMNPSSVHAAGLAAKRVLAGAREAVAGAIGAGPEEIVFTGGGSEAINAAIKGTVWASGMGRPHIISTAVEHHAVLRSLAWLQERGAEVTLLPVDRRCLVDPAAVAEAITPQTVLVSVMHVNNEVGAIQPVEDIGAICRERGVVFHVDAVQAMGKIPVDVGAINCDLLSCSAHKLGGMKGVGALYVRRGVELAPLVHGGPQEAGLRAGTQNVAGIAGFAEAVRISQDDLPGRLEHWRRLREPLHRLARDLESVRVNSHPDHTVPNCVNMTFMFCDGMALATNLNRKGVCVSTGSACTARDLKPSHVLRAMGLSERAAHGAIRFSTGPETTLEEVSQAADIVKRIVERLRLVTMPEDIGVCKDDCTCFVNG